MRPPTLRRGLALGSVLMVSALAFTVLSVLVGAGFFHLNFANHSGHQEVARELAEAAVGAALESIIANPDFGTAGHSSYHQPLEVKPDWAPAGSRGVLAFSTQGASAAKIGLYSTNNAAGESAVTGCAQVSVPKHCLRLVGVGECAGVKRTVEIFFAAPPFPYSIASAGAVSSSGGLLVGSLTEGEIWDTTGGPDLDKVKPGNLRSNSSADQAIKLGPDSLISGDVEAAGGIELDAGTRVLGTSRPHSGTSKLPQLNPRDYDPRDGREPVNFNPVGAELTAPTIQGTSRAPGDLTIYGDLELDGGVLYVAGNLKITGGIKGKGAVITAGNLNVGQASNFSSENRVALLADGDLSLSGGGADRSFIQGLLYTNGAFASHDMTLMGTLVKSGDESDGIEIRNTQTIQVPEYTSFVMETGNPPGQPQLNISSRLDNASGGPPVNTYTQGSTTVSDFVGFWLPSGSSVASLTYDSATDTYDPNKLTMSNMIVSFGTRTWNPDSWNQFTRIADAGGLTLARNDPRWRAAAGGNPDGYANQLLNQARGQISAYNQSYQTWKAQVNQGPVIYGTAKFKLDLNSSEVLALGDRLRLLRWSEL